KQMPIAARRQVVDEDDTMDTMAEARFPLARPRRLRATPALRRMVRETSLDAGDFIYPLFVTHGRYIARPIASMPGVSQLSADRLPELVESVAQLRVPAVMLFGIPESKDPIGLDNF